MEVLFRGLNDEKCLGVKTVLGRNMAYISTITLTTTVLTEVYLKHKLPVSYADCCNRHFINLCAVFATIKLINNSISFTNKQYARSTKDCIPPVITLALSLKFPKKWPPKMLKIAIINNPTVIDVPSLGNSRDSWPTFLPLIVLVYLHSNFCAAFNKTHLCSRSRSSKVIDFGTDRKCILCNFLLVCHSNLGPTVSEILQVCCSETDSHPYST